jgi:hypothetical protein
LLDISSMDIEAIKLPDPPDTDANPPSSQVLLPMDQDNRYLPDPPDADDSSRSSSSAGMEVDMPKPPDPPDAKGNGIPKFSLADKTPIDLLPSEISTGVSIKTEPTLESGPIETPELPPPLRPAGLTFPPSLPNDTAALSPPLPDGVTSLVVASYPNVAPNEVTSCVASYPTPDEVVLYPTVAPDEVTSRAVYSPSPDEVTSLDAFSPLD